MPWNREKIRKVVSKQSLWIVFSLWTGFTFVGYFTPIRELGSEIMTTVSGQGYALGPWETFWVFFYALATYGNAGFLREQVCLYMCPYARFQSVMFDPDTLIISYDEARGEPRMKGKARKEAGDAAGDCVDCNMCVQVCPTGIDIRDGLQYECIACAACVDVCDDVMERHDLPKGLIRYTTENALKGKPSKILRPRTLIYGVLLSLLILGLALAIGLRQPLDVEVLRDRNAFFRIVDESHIANIYTLKVLNKSDHDQVYELKIDGLEGASIEWVRSNRVAAGEMGTLPVRIVAPNESVGGVSQAITLEVAETRGDRPGHVTRETRFFGPEARGLR
jgi:cytochrome c oxidase accessory protein FixG